MYEAQATEVELSQVSGATLQALVAHMYGKLQDITLEQLLPLFVAADAHQVSKIAAIFSTEHRSCVTVLSLFTTGM